MASEQQIKTLDEQFKFYRVNKALGSYSVAVERVARATMGKITVTKPAQDVKNGYQDTFSGYSAALLEDKNQAKQITAAKADQEQIAYLISLL